jgi:hypothetical protein
MKKLVAVALGLLSVILLLSCSDSNNGNGTDPEPNGDGIQMQSVNGSVNLPSGSPLNTSGMQVNSALNKGSVGGDGNFAVNAPVTPNYQLLLALSQGGKAAMLSLIQPGSGGGQIDLSSMSTAKALLIMSPLFARASSSDKLSILNQLTGRSDFLQLEDNIKNLLINDPEGTLDYSKHPRIFEQASQVAIEFLKSQGTNSGDDPSTKIPFVEDVAGEGIRFSNPGAVYYAAGVYESGTSNLKSVVLIGSDDSKSDFVMGWPPRLVVTQNTKTDYMLGDGTYEVKVTRGFDFTEGAAGVMDWATPEGRATIANIGKAVLDMTESTTGYKFDVDLADLSITISSSQAAKFTDGMRQGNSWKVAEAVSEVIESNKSAINTWLWSDASTSAGRDFMSHTQGIVKDISSEVKVVGVGEADLDKAAPFFYDLSASTPSVKYTVVQTGGVAISTKNESPAKPGFLGAPEQGTQYTPVSFTGLGTDPEGDNVSYRFSWGDGTSSDWTGYSASGSQVALSHTYTEAGTFVVTVQAKDEHGSLSQPSDGHEIVVTAAGSMIYDNFNNDLPGGRPSDPPWTTETASPSYVRISNTVYKGSSGNSCGFHDYDPDIEEGSDTAYAVIYADIEDAASGTLEFDWRITTINDGFGVRTWETDEDSWNSVGYYVLFYNGAIQYWDPNSGTFASIMSVTTETWYHMSLAFDRSALTYDIYIDGELKVDDAPFVHSVDYLNRLQILAFSDDVCRAAYIDNVNLSSGMVTIGSPGSGPALTREVTSLRPPAAETK